MTHRRRIPQIVSASKLSRTLIYGALIPTLAAPVLAQGSPRRLPLIEELRLDLVKERLDGSVVAIGPKGQVITAPSFSSGAIGGFDSTGRSLGWSLSVGGRDDEIRWVNRIGWAGETMWVVDQGFRQIALVDARGEVTKSLEHPTWVRPSWADRRKYPVFGRLDPIALYPDGSWLVRPYREHSLLATPGYDTAMTHIVRIGADGVIQRTIARFPHDAQTSDFRPGAPVRRPMAVAFGQRTMWQASRDGQRFIVVSLPKIDSPTGPDTSSILITALGERGDTAYSRRVSVSVVQVTSQTIDSIRSSMRVGNPRAEIAAHVDTVNRVPTHYPPVRGLLVGRDHTVWIELRRPGGAFEWLGLDVGGQSIGVVALPDGMTLRDADRDHLWVTDSKGTRPSVLVRYGFARRG